MSNDRKLWREFSAPLALSRAPEKELLASDTITWESRNRARYIAFFAELSSRAVASSSRPGGCDSSELSPRVRLVVLHLARGGPSRSRARVSIRPGPVRRSRLRNGRIRTARISRPDKRIRAPAKLRGLFRTRSCPTDETHRTRRRLSALMKDPLIPFLIPATLSPLYLER